MTAEITCPMCQASSSTKPADYDVGRIKCGNCGEWIALSGGHTGETTAAAAPPPPPPPRRSVSGTVRQAPAAPAGPEPDTVSVAPLKPVPGRTRLQALFRKMADVDASDLHVKVGAPPAFRIRGETISLQAPPFGREEIESMLREVLTPEQVKGLEEERSVDMSMGLDQTGRFRVNAFYQRGSPSLCVRLVKAGIPSIEELHLPTALAKVADYHDGLVLVNGPTGSGKSTTLATMIDAVNRTRRAHIITIEDPIEYVHEDKHSFITQREIGVDVRDALTGLENALRQAPDVILIGELRDKDMVETTIQASETGHLVMSTVHATDAAETMRRMLLFFPLEQHDNLRTVLAGSLRAIVSQRMVIGCTEAAARLVMMELLFVNDVIRQILTDAQFERLPQQFVNYANDGFQDFNTSLLRLVRLGLIESRVAMAESPKPSDLEAALSGRV